MSEKYKDENTLREMYHGRELSMREISELLNCGTNTVKRWLQKFGIPTRGCHEITDPDPWHDEETLRKWYNKGFSFRELSDKWDIHHSTIEYWMESHGIETRNRHEERRKGPTSHFWSEDGYELVKSGNKEVAVHRLVMIAEEGMDSIDSWTDDEVHHKNGHPADNSPENLELLSTSEHSALHSMKEEDWR